ncbi:MAG: hypothetical protein Q9191_003981 [Dirinaria sp. TL-2023a]
MATLSSPHSLPASSNNRFSNSNVRTGTTTTSQDVHVHIKYTSSTTSAPPIRVNDLSEPLGRKVNDTEAIQTVDNSTRQSPKPCGLVLMQEQPPGSVRSDDLKRNELDDGSSISAKPRRNSTMDTDASVPFHETEVWDKKAILSLDGGGIRGFSALLIIRALMREIGKIEKSYKQSSDTSDGPAESSYHPLSSDVTAATDSDSSNGSNYADAPVTDSSPWLPCHYFDYMAGTSTGGLISIMLGRLRMNIDDCIRDYETLGKKVFGQSRWFHLRQPPPFFFPRDKYNHRVLQEVVQDVVRQRIPKVSDFPGGRNFAFDENRCRVVVVANQETKIGGVRSPYLFRTYKNLHRSKVPKEKALDRNPGPAHDVPIWEVARATSAAPTYFKPAKIDHRKYLDGGFGETNNPSIEIYDEVRRMNNDSNDCISILVSIGTGKNKKMSQWTDKKLRGLQYINYINFAKAWASQSETQHTAMMKEEKKFRFVYERLNVEDGLDTMKLDEWRTTARIRVGLGKCVGKWRHWFAKDNCSGKGAENDDSTGSTLQAETLKACDACIPEWLQFRNKTIDRITRNTNLYLENAEVQKQIQKCAKILVEGRRARALKDPQRWEKACFSAWYQCAVDGCPRGEKEYLDRKKLQSHLLDKHGDIYKTMTDEDVKNLETTLDSFKIVVH